MICPNCEKDIPDESTFCLNCGAEIRGRDSTTREQTAIADSVTPEQAPMQSRKFLIGVAVCISVVLLLFGIIQYANTVTPHRLTAFQLYNQELGTGLKLGMSKTQVDKLLGTPERVNDGYCYRDTVLYAHYLNGNLASMYITVPNQRWNTIGGITTGYTTDDLVDAIGQPDSIEHDDTWWYYLRGNQVSGFEISGYSNEIMSIYIYDKNLPDA